MNKTELIDSMAKLSGLSKKDSEKAFNALIDSITDALLSKEDVNILNFGSFKVKTRAERMGLNLQTKEKIKIPARDVVSFVSGKALKEKIQQNGIK